MSEQENKTVGYTIQVPFAPGEQIWMCGYEPEVRKTVCPECEGSLAMTIETRTGRYEVPCEACSVGYQQPSGWIAESGHRSVPQPITLGAPNVERDGRVWYSEAGQSSGTMYYTDRLFRSFEECQRRCVELDAEAAERNASYNEQRSKNGRNGAARHFAYRKKEIARLEKDLAWNRDRLKVLEERSGGGAR